MKYNFIFILVLINFSVLAQEVETKKILGDSLYQINIKKTRLYGVYIPKDIPDAILELEKLSTPEAKGQLKKIDEKTAAKKLRFGIGRWMEYNWNLQEGSRFAHYLREQGIWNIDDMVDCMIILFHRHVLKKPLNENELMAEIIKTRTAISKQNLDKNMVEIIDEK
ncbi:MAG: DUF6794 domain-containing protein [Saprospiraceae bacterium]